MSNKVHEETIELLLAAMSQESGSGLKCSFMFGNTAEPWSRNFGEELYFSDKPLVRASLYVRQNGPTNLRAIAIQDIRKMLQDFVCDNYWHVFGEICFKRFKGTYADRLSADTKKILAEALGSSHIFQPRDQLTLYPLVPVQVKEDFDEGPFFLIAPASLSGTILKPYIDPQYIAPDRFPPQTRYAAADRRPSAWLGVRSPTYQASNKMKAAILGALALTPPANYRHLFSGRKMFGGRCTLADGTITISPMGEPHTPPLASDIFIRRADHSWLVILANILRTNTREVRRQLCALEYFHRAWGLDPPERFAVLCMTLDSIFGDVSHATQAVIEGVRSVLGSHLREARLRLLMELRASVIHGGAPDVYDSRKYDRYYDKYGADPIHDLELVVANCLRLKIFGETMKIHPNPRATVIAEEQAKGTLPKDLSRGTIIDDIPPAATS